MPDTFNANKFSKLIRLIAYTIGNKPYVGKTFFYKVLYFIDFNYYELYRESITGETYYKLPRGPAPSHFDSVVNILESKKLIKISKKKRYKYEIFKYNTEIFNSDMITCFTKNELNIILGTLKFFSNYNATQISNFSHLDAPWMLTELYQPIKYEFALIRSSETSANNIMTS
ncbi:MAG: Panacea domain-containing protein [Candidatus Methanofastidiosia archaeon]